MDSKRLVKTLVLSLLIAVGVMAMSASAAQAKWLLLKSGASVENLSLQGTASSFRILLPELGAEIHCTGGVATAAINLSEAQKKLTASLQVTFSGCSDLAFGKTCAVGSEGQANGTIVVSGSGVAAMSGEEYFVDMAGEFAFVEYRGALCPLDETDHPLEGKLRLDLLNALENTKLKVADLLDKGLFFWGQTPTFVHDGEEKPISLSLTEVSGATWGLHLVGL